VASFDAHVAAKFSGKSKKHNEAVHAGYSMNQTSRASRRSTFDDIQPWIGSGRFRRAVGCRRGGAARAEEIYYRGGQHMMAIAFHASGAEPGFGKRNQELHQASASGIGSAFRFSREQRALLMTF